MTAHELELVTRARIKTFLENTIRFYHPHNPRAILNSINLIIDQTNQTLVLQILETVNPRYLKIWQQTTLLQ